MLHTLSNITQMKKYTTNGCIGTSQNWSTLHQKQLECEDRGWDPCWSHHVLSWHPFQARQIQTERGRKNGLRRKKSGKEWLERLLMMNGHKTQPMHDGNSPGSHGLQFYICNRMWTSTVSEVCGNWQRGTHGDGRLMEATTSVTHPNQPQATHHGAHPHGYMAVVRVDDHTVLTLTPFIHPNYTHFINYVLVDTHIPIHKWTRR